MADTRFHIAQAHMMGANLYTLKNKKCIRMGIIVLKIVIWGDKSSVLWTEIAFYGSTNVSL